MDRRQVLEGVRTASSTKEERESFERLREWVAEHPDDREAQDILQELNEGEWRAVQERLGAAEAARRFSR